MFLLLPHLSIYFLKISTMEPIALAWQSLIIAVAFFIIFKTLEINKFILYALINMLIILCSSVANNVVTLGIIFTLIVFISFVIYLNYATRNFKELISGLYYLSVLIVAMSFISLFLPMFNENGERMYFLGGKNQIAMTTVITIPIIYMYSLSIYNKIKPFPILIILMGISTTFLAGSGTGIVISVLTALFVFSPIRKFPSYKSYMFVYIFIFFGLVVYRLHEKLFGDFIINVLHKDLTLTNRTYIWDVVIDKYKESWIIGSGRGNQVINEKITWLNVNEAHNGFLQIALETGIIGILSLIFILIMVGKKIKIKKNHLFSKVLSFSIFAYMIIGLTESAFHRKELWILLILAYGVENITKQVTVPKMLGISQQ